MTKFLGLPYWRREYLRRGELLLSDPPQAESLDIEWPVQVQVESRLEAGSLGTGQKFSSESERSIFQ